jgi:tetratricopeptide (TPR) repeat protein
MGGYVLGLALVLVPVGIRNRAVSGEWSFSTFQAGPNFFIGNNREADGRYRPLVRGHETPEFERADATRLAQEALGRGLSAREVSDYWMSRARSDIRAAPGAWVRLMALKFALTWNRYEIADLESPVVYAESSRLLGILDGVWHFGVLVPMAALGAWRTRDRWRDLWVVHALIFSMALAVALFFVLGRYRFALVPLLVPFAAVGLVSLLECLAARTRGRASNGSGDPAPRRGLAWWHWLLWLALTAAVNWPIQDERRLDALALTNLGSVLGAEGDLEGATRWLRKAVEGHPQSAEARFNLAYALSLKGEHAEAIVHFRAALALEPALMHVDFLLGQSLEAQGEREAALRHYARAVELDPAHQEARAALERLRGPR